MLMKLENIFFNQVEIFWNSIRRKKCLHHEQSFTMKEHEKIDLRYKLYITLRCRKRWKNISDYSPILEAELLYEPVCCSLTHRVTGETISICNVLYAYYSALIMVY